MKFFRIIFVSSLFLVKCFAYGGNEAGGISLAAPQSTGGSSGYDASSGAGGISLNGGGGVNIAGPISLSGPARNSAGSYLGGGGGGGGGGLGRYQAAIFTKHTVETRPVMTSNELTQPAIIEVDGGDLPLELVFKSTTSRLKVRQQHVSTGGGQIQETNSEEPLSILRNTVRRPIIQEVREIILPSRRIVQEIHPVQEVIETIVARAQSLSEGRGQDGGSAPQIRNTGGNAAISLGGLSGLGLDLNSRGFAGGNGGGNGAGTGAGLGAAIGAGTGGSGNGAIAYNTVSGNSLNRNGAISLPVSVPISSGSTGTKGGY